MKPILLFILKNCPHCKRALQWQNELIAENPVFSSIPLEIVDEREQSARARSYNYFLVPTYYVDGVKVHEGIASKQKIKEILDAAL